MFAVNADFEAWGLDNKLSYKRQCCSAVGNEVNAH